MNLQTLAARRQITTRDKTTNSGSTRAGSRPVERDLTEILADGVVVDTIIWTAPLLRRLDRKGVTREAYVARRAQDHVAMNAREIARGL